MAAAAAVRAAAVRVPAGGARAAPGRGQPPRRAALPALPRQRAHAASAQAGRLHQRVSTTQCDNHLLYPVCLVYFSYENLL